jgi:formylglycine-generating enzyme required for sulfatase activity
VSDAESRLYNWKKNPSAEVTVVGAGETLQKFQPNRYGIYHLGGNVVEWTQGLRRAFNQEKPYEPDDRNREDSPEVRVVRGGSWYSASNALLYVPYRDHFLPEISHDDLGFRIVVRSLMF